LGGTELQQIPLHLTSFVSESKPSRPLTATKQPQHPKIRRKASRAPSTSLLLFHPIPIAVTGANKALLETSEYEPYGQVVNATAKDGPGFTGHVLDAATGMNYMQQRYYDPQIGRFLSVDPVTAYSNPVGAFNRYWYANNNPYKFTDPDGREVSCAGGTCQIRSANLGEFISSDFPRYVGITIQTAALDAATAYVNTIQAVAAAAEGGGEGKPAPNDLVGTSDGKGGRQGERINNGPLSPDNGGSGNANEDFDHLTGGGSAPAPEGSRLPEGSRIGDNGVIYRPPSGNSGPRIDIPGNGDKPHETLHYPKPLKE